MPKDLPSTEIEAREALQKLRELLVSAGGNETASVAVELSNWQIVTLITAIDMTYQLRK